MLKLLQKAERYKKKNNWQRIFRRVICAIACVGVFCTTYAFVLPIITRGEDGFALEGYYTQSTESADTEFKEFYDNPNYWFEQLGGQYNPSDNSNSSGSDSDVSINSSDDQSGADGAIHDKTNSEHVASCLVCKNDPKADVETTAQWEEIFANIALGNGWGADLVAIARSQLGYKESTRNYKVMEDGETIKGYTRYGAWYGDTYGDWSAMFVSFCLNYALIPWDVVPYEASCSKWVEVLGNYNYNMYRPAAEYTPALGDLIFFDDDANGSADRVGIVSEVSYSNVKVIMGANGQVTEKAYKLDNGKILGYGQIPKEASVYFCGQQAHVHNDSCNVESGVITCKKQEHVHTEKCLHAPEGKPQSDLLPKCDCDGNTKEHSNGCARYQYIRNTYIYESTATEIYEAWEALSEEDRDAVLTLMGAEPNLQEKFKKLKYMLEQSDSLYVEFGDGTKLSAEGIPMDAVLVATPGSEEKQLVSDSLAGNSATENQKVFFNKAYDIKVVQGEQVWQPGVGETVKLTLATNSDEFTYKSQLKVTHILDDVNDILRAADSDAYSVHTQAGLSEIFPEACEAAMAAGYEKDTIVYTIMTPQDGNVAFDSKGNVIIYAESFSTYAVSAYNASAVAEDGSGLVVDKTVSHVENNRFKLQLDAYIKGGATSTPTDIVLLIDQSASMWSAVDNTKKLTYDDIKNDTEHGKRIGYYIMFTTVKNPSLEWYGKQYGGEYTNAAALMRYDNNRWEVSRWLFMANYDKAYGDAYPGKKYEEGWFDDAHVGDSIKIRPNSTADDPATTDLTSIGWRPYTDAITEIKSGAQTRIYQTVSGALYDALNVFMKEMELAKNCRIAIATFAGDVNNSYFGSGIFFDGVLTEDYIRAEGEGITLPSAQYREAFEEPSSAQGRENLYKAVNSLCTNHDYTPTAFGLRLVRRLFYYSGYRGVEGRNNVAIVFTDGLPTRDYLPQTQPGYPIVNMLKPPDYTTKLLPNYEAEVIAAGYQAKDYQKSYKVDGITYQAVDNPSSVRFHHYSGASDRDSVLTQYDLGAWHNTTTTDGYITKGWKSTYIDQAYQIKKDLKATVFTIGPTATIEEDSTDRLKWIATDDEHFYYVAGSQLNATFKEIAGVMLSTSFTPDENMYLQDVISDKFTLPADITTANIDKYIQAYKVNRIPNTNDFYGISDINNTSRWKPIPTSDISFDDDTKTVKVNNLEFNNASSWVVDGGSTGYKVVVFITIDALYSGTKLATNKTASSAVYYGAGTPAKYFPLPYADVPTSVKLIKKFNRTDEDWQFAFTAEYVERPTDVSTAYTKELAGGEGDSNYLKINPSTKKEQNIILKRDGAEKVFQDLPVGTTITISEERLAGYTVTVTVKKGDGTVVQNYTNANGNISLTLDPNIPVTPSGIPASDNNYNYIIEFENYAGFELPSTGGVGTHLYTVGGLLLIIAAILLYIYHCIYRKEGSILSNK